MTTLKLQYALDIIRLGKDNVDESLYLAAVDILKTLLQP